MQRQEAAAGHPLSPPYNALPLASYTDGKLMPALADRVDSAACAAAAAAAALDDDAALATAGARFLRAGLPLWLELLAAAARGSDCIVELRKGRGKIWEWTRLVGLRMDEDAAEDSGGGERRGEERDTAVGHGGGCERMHGGSE